MDRFERLEQAVTEERARLAKLDPSGLRLSRADLERLERALDVERKRVELAWSHAMSGEG